MLDAQQIGGELAAMVKAQFGPMFAQMEAKLEALEKRIESLPVPTDGKDAKPEDAAAIVAAQFQAEFDQIRSMIPTVPEPEPLPDIAKMIEDATAERFAQQDQAISDVQRGLVDKSAVAFKSDLDDLRKAIPAIPQVEPLPDIDAMVKAAVADAIAGLPEPEPFPDVEAIVADAIKAIPPAAEPEPLPDVAAMVKAAVDVIEVPKPDIPDISALVVDAVTEAVKALPPAERGKDGVGLAGALIDREGSLVVTLTNGEAKTLGPVVGKDATGKDGADGLGFDDMEMDYDGERTFTFKFQKGERVVERKFVAPVMLDRGVYRPGTFEKGDSVTYGGSIWIAQKETNAKPGQDDSWRLAVKKGRDGSDGTVKATQPVKPLRLRGGGDAD